MAPPGSLPMPRLPALLIAVLALVCAVPDAPAEGGLRLEGGISIGAPPSAAPPPQPAVRHNPASYARPGPWGRLRKVEIFLEASESVVARFPMPAPQTTWAIPSTELDAVAERLAQAGMRAPSIRRLLDPANRSTDKSLVRLHPLPDEIEQLTPQGRARWYAELATYPENDYARTPMVMTLPDPREWFRTSGLRPELLATIQRLSYPFGEAIAFSDIPLLLGMAESRSEALAILKAATRTRALLVKLELDRSSDLAEILEYWTTGLNLRRKDIEPMLTAIRDVEGAERLDVVHLLPALARKLLYTYPAPEMARQGVLPDCHWTSLNFFNSHEDDFLLEDRIAADALVKEFRAVSPPYRFGDLLLFLNDRGEAVHSAIYLADDIVFTKNGRNTTRPWILSTLSDLNGSYLHASGTRMEGRRRIPAP